MARCRWCGIEAESDNVCVWCRRPLYEQVGAMPVVDRHLPVDNRTSFLPESVDYTTAFPLASGAVLVAAIVVGVGFLSNASPKKPANKSVAGTVAERQFSAIYEKGQELASDDEPTPQTPPATNTRLAGYVSPSRQAAPVQPAGKAAPDQPNRRVRLEVGYVVRARTSSQISVETEGLTYSEDVGAYVGVLKIENMTPNHVEGFSLQLRVDATTLALIPFTGKPSSPKPMGSQRISSGDSLTCPVIAYGPAPERSSVKTISLVARMAGGAGTISIEATAP